ncbi:MAG TPA: response regulator [Phenylobacterium sp.]
MILDQPGAKVMVAESDRTIAELLRIRLDVAGYQTSLVRSGRDVLETLRAARPAALMLEMRLPDINGFEILRLIQVARLSLPTLIMGKDLSTEEIRRAVALGARDVMVKPFSGATPLERVARLLKLSAQQHAKAA